MIQKRTTFQNGMYTTIKRKILIRFLWDKKEKIKMKTLLTSILIVVCISNVFANKNKEIFAEMSLGADKYTIAENYMNEKNFSEAYKFYRKAKKHFRKVLELSSTDDLYYSFVSEIIVSIDIKIKLLEAKEKSYVEK